MAKCMCCGNPIQPTFWVCDGCERGYGLAAPVSKWPEWAKQLRRDTEKERQQEARMMVEIPASDVPGIDRLLYGEDGEFTDDGGIPPVPAHVAIFR